jgi:hypothetical protein
MAASRVSVREWRCNERSVLTITADSWRVALPEMRSSTSLLRLVPYSGRWDCFRVARYPPLIGVKRNGIAPSPSPAHVGRQHARLKLQIG